jgi:hypothetical protein
VFRTEKILKRAPWGKLFQSSNVMSNATFIFLQNKETATRVVYGLLNDHLQLFICGLFNDAISSVKRWEH